MPKRPVHPIGFTAVVLAGLGLTSGCRQATHADDAKGEATPGVSTRAAVVKPRSLPGLRAHALPDAGDGSSPRVTSIAEGLALAWISQAKTPTLALATLPFAEADAGWSEPQIVTASSRLLVNWADVAAIGETAAGRTVLAWPEYHEDDPKAGYGLRVAAQLDDGTFAPAWSPDDVQRGPESGFVQFVGTPAGLRMFWLDGRELTGHGGHGGHGDHGGTMQLRSVLLDDDGRAIGSSEVLDDRTCECCKLGVGLLGEQAFAAYRDRSDAEVRDIFVAGPGLSPTRVANDGWTIAGCPVNGPAVASDGARAYIAWFSGADDRSATWIATASTPASFEAPIRFDLGLPAGRVDLLATPDGGALITWFEYDADAPGRALLLTRRLGREGRLGPAFEIAVVGAARDWGFPRTAMVGEEVLWIVTDPTPASGRPRLQGLLGPLPDL